MLLATASRADELAALLPDEVPGYGLPFSVTDNALQRRIDHAAGMQFGGVTMSPSVNVNTGYDSAPSGTAPASALIQVVPSILVADQQIGLGAYASGTMTQYPENQAQNITGYTVALGERLVLPRETITAAIANLATEETGFSLTPILPGPPAVIHVTDTRLQDKIALSQFTLTPALSVTDYTFGASAGEDRVDFRETLTAGYAPGGPSEIVLRLNAAQSRYTQDIFDSDTKEILAGLQDNAEGLWTIKLLAGAAHRDARLGGSLTAPVLEASADWMPDRLDHVRFTAAHEIDDPDEISATDYTLDNVAFSLQHEYLRNLDLAFSLAVSHAAYAGSDHVETVVATGWSLKWSLSAAFAIEASYHFNDRQANFLSADDEHLLMAGVTWTP